MRPSAFISTMAIRDEFAPSLANLINADLDSHEAWRQNSTRALRPLGLSRHGRVSAGCRGGRQRSNVSGAFVERLIAELRARFTFVVLDVGREPPGKIASHGGSLCARLTRCSWSLPRTRELSRARVAVHDAAAILDRRPSGAGAQSLRLRGCAPTCARSTPRSGCRS